MRINPFSTNIDNRPSFKAYLLKDNVELADYINDEPINAAIVEMETETRELLADARYRARQKFSDDEFDKMYTQQLLSFHDKYSALDKIRRETKEEIYIGDYKFMEELVKRDNLPYIHRINERVQNTEIWNKKPAPEYVSYIGKYWKEYTNGKMDTLPSKNYGLLDKKLGEYIRTGYPCALAPIDSPFAKAFDYSSRRQRVLLAVEQRDDGNYRNMGADTKVYGIAEAYTERAMDAFEDYCTERDEQIAKAIEKGKEYDELIDKWKETKDDTYARQADELSFKIAREGKISYSDFMRRTYEDEITKNKLLKREAMENFCITEDKIEPVNAFLIGTLSSITGAGKALLEAICDKGKYCGVFADTGETMTEGFFNKYGFRNILGWKENKLFKPGVFKVKF